MKATLAGIFVAAALAAFGATVPDRFDGKVRNDFFAGYAGNADALARGMKSCEEILASNPKHAEALVWHGSGLYFQAGLAFRNGGEANGRRLFGAGLKEMDTAVAYQPDSVAVRVPRGATLLTGSRGIPDPASARPLIEKGVGDYEAVLARQESTFASLGEHLRGELLFGLAEGYSRLGNNEKAQVYFERILAGLKGTEYASRAEIWLKDKSLPQDRAGCVGCHVK